ncbi:MAG: hypothetical protein GF409_01070 [Candidatus Omnitrophica bacterium]|nr:hypothetical protein [Candidatus Omnitrophota bacterium]
MKALGILAGPRKGWASDQMLDKVLEGLKDNGADVEKIHLYDLDIRHCTGCGSCTPDKCVIEDDHQMVLDKVASSEVVVFASPTYWSNVTSMAKAFIDRGGSLFEMTSTGPRRTADKPARVVLITSCGMPFPLSHLLGTATGCIRAMKVFFGRMNVKIKTLYATGMLDYLKSKPSRRQLEKAYRMGKCL